MEPARNAQAKHCVHGYLSLEVEPMPGAVLLGRHELFLPLLFSLPIEALVRLPEQSGRVSE